MVDLRACAIAAVVAGCSEAAAPRPAEPTGDMLAERYRACWAHLDAACTAIDDVARALTAALPGAAATPQLVLVNEREIASVVAVRGDGAPVLVFHRAELDLEAGTAREWWLVGDGDDAPVRPSVIARHDDRELHNADAHRRLAMLFAEEDASALDRLGDALPGRAAIAADMRTAWTALDGIRVEIARSWGAGDHTVLTGQIRAVAGTVPSQRRVLDLPFAHVIEWRDGSAVASHLVLDRRELARQLATTSRQLSAR